MMKIVGCLLLALVPALVNCESCFNQVLKEGSRGSCVTQLQQMLGISADGIFGPGAKAAVVAFQQKHGLGADGVVGPSTWAVLADNGQSAGPNLEDMLPNPEDLKCMTANVKKGSKGRCVKIVQALLGLTPDGDFGSGTAAAVKKFQQAQSLGSTGQVDEATAKALEKAFKDGTLKPKTCGCTYEKAYPPCGLGPTVGARNLAEFLDIHFGGEQQIFNCRTVRGRKTLSLHSKGRAVDLFVDKATGDKAFQHLIKIGCDFGIQEVIWYRQIWTKKGLRAYKGVNPHVDHLHIGLNNCGADNFFL